MEARITTVEGLLKALDMCTGDSCVIDIMNETKIPVSELERYYSWNDQRYTRNLLAKTDKFEVLLVCFEKGQESLIHEFDADEAWIHPVSGSLKEERFVKSTNGKGLVQVSSVCLGDDDFSYMRDVSLHRYKNVNGARSVCLVIFSPTINHLDVYDEETGKMAEQDVWHDKVFNLMEDIYNAEA